MLIPFSFSSEEILAKTMHVMLFFFAQLQLMRLCLADCLIDWIGKVLLDGKVSYNIWPELYVQRYGVTEQSVQQN